VTNVRSTEDESLPLRTFLVCRTCGRPVTGSSSSGNGGKYYYYRCQTATACKERFRAGKAHEIFEEMLRSISAEKEIAELYKLIMSEYFRGNGADKTRQTKEKQAQIDKLKTRVRNAHALLPMAEKRVIEPIGENAVLTLIAAMGAAPGDSKKGNGRQIADLSTLVPQTRNLSNLFPRHLEAISRFLDLRTSSD